MAIRTYIPAILAFANYFKKFVNKNSTVLKERMGEGLYSVIVLVMDILVIGASLINSGAPASDEPWTDFTAINTLNSTTINQLQAAWDKFLATNGITV